MNVVMGRMREIVLVCCVLFSVAQVNGAAITGTFSGADSGNNLFSDTDNWSPFPVPDGALNPNFGSPVQAGTSAANPGQLDAPFNLLLPNGFGNAFVTPNGTGSAVIEVLDGGEFKAINVSIGHGGVSARSGQLTLKSGSLLNSFTANNGTLTVGGITGTASPAQLIADDGVAGFTFANLNLGGTGVMTYNFGTHSVSTFTSEKSNGAALIVLDGVLQVDLTADPTVGTYVLIDSSHTNTTLTGALATWLAGEGGSFSSTGDYAGSNFEVLDGGTIEWTLQISSNTLELVVDVAGHDLTEVAVKDTFLRNTLANNRTDLGGTDTLFVDGNGGIRGILEFDLSGAESSITNAALTLTQTADRTGTWTFDVYPMVYTENNYSWYEGTGTVTFADNVSSPAALNGAACYQYQQDDATTPFAWEDGSGTVLNNAGNSALWGAAIGSVSGSNSVSGRQITYALDAAVLETFRTNGVGRIVLGIWGTDTLSGNHFVGSRENANADWRPTMDLLMASGESPAAPVITSISVGAVGGGSSAASVAFDAGASASLWFTPDMVSPIWTHVISGASPLGHTNDSPTGFYKVSIP